MSSGLATGLLERLNEIIPLQWAVGALTSATKPSGSLGTTTENHSGEMAVQWSAVCTKAGVDALAVGGRSANGMGDA